MLMLWFNDQGTCIQGSVHINLDPSDQKGNSVSCPAVTGVGTEEVGEALRKALSGQLGPYSDQRPGRANYADVVKNLILDVGKCVYA